jgi:hypothetical protein
VAGDLHHVEVPDQVRLDVGVRVLDRIAHAGLRAEMDDPSNSSPSSAARQRRLSAKSTSMKRNWSPKSALLLGDPVALQLGAVIIVDVVDADHALAARHQARAT